MSAMPPLTMTLPGHASADRRFPVVHRYASLRDLSMALKRLGQHNDDEIVSVLVVLDTAFCGDLRSVIRRHHAAYRLTITGLTPHVCLPLRRCELAMECDHLGWRSIDAEGNLAAAYAIAQSTPTSAERVVIFWPQWRDAAALSRLNSHEGTCPAAFMGS